MKAWYWLLAVAMHVILALTVPFFVKLAATCVYILLVWMGIENGADVIGEESGFFILLPIVLVHLGVFVAAIVAGNRYLSRKIGIGRVAYSACCAGTFLVALYAVNRIMPIA
ncbi:hypothetical protein [Paenibacillus methanolicus]|uniref:Uncharacterized protein n=1 Tax=Paenibacillus methanolicus TaxID=582686 RepID=A0A5S5C5L0_9BACL|nr:hypothetical protein [Paenibacillus methanolicus]TYP74705.1 hypothetical protein BCM02_105249 [Paenibacillus methanolicus]